MGNARLGVLNNFRQRDYVKPEDLKDNKNFIKPMNLDYYRKTIKKSCRESILLNLKLPNKELNNSFTSKKGGVFYDLPQKRWPVHNKKPLIPFLQIKFNEIEYDLEIDKPLAGISVFIDSFVDYGVFSQENSCFVIRELPKNSELTPLSVPNELNLYEPQKIVFEKVVDYPDDFDFEHIFSEYELEYLENLAEPEYDSLIQIFPNQDNTKIGGWPSNCQNASNQITDNEYFWLQINDEFHLPFGDCAVFHIIKTTKNSGWYSFWETS